MSAAELIEAAIARNLDAICVTDHYLARGAIEAQALARRAYGFPVFRGLETNTTLGDILVYGVALDAPRGADGPELLRYVRDQGGASVLAHPFRLIDSTSFWSWLERQGQPLDASLATRPELACLDAIETFNGHVNAAEVALAEDLARVLGLPTCGGSDAHHPHSVGVTVTEFARPVADEQELVREIRAGRVRPRRLR